MYNYVKDHIIIIVWSFIISQNYTQFCDYMEFWGCEYFDSCTTVVKCMSEKVAQGQHVDCWSGHIQIYKIYHDIQL